MKKLLALFLVFCFAYATAVPISNTLHQETELIPPSVSPPTSNVEPQIVQPSSGTGSGGGGGGALGDAECKPAPPFTFNMPGFICPEKWICNGIFWESKNAKHIGLPCCNIKCIPPLSITKVDTDQNKEDLPLGGSGKMPKIVYDKIVWPDVIEKIEKYYKEVYQQYENQLIQDAEYFIFVSTAFICLFIWSFKRRRNGEETEDGL